MDNHPRTLWRRTRIDRLAGLALAVLAIPACERGPLEPAASDGAAAVVRAPSRASLTADASAPFGTFKGIAYVRYTGFFEGVTSLGAFRMPYEIVAPADPSQGNGTVLVEPPHFALGLTGRDDDLGREFLFGNGFSYAAVGFGENLFNILDPGASGLMLAGAPVAAPGSFNPPGILDEEIIIQFAEALTNEPFAAEILGNVQRRYAYGVSQTAQVLLELQREVVAEHAASPFDLTLLHVALWHSPFPLEAPFDYLGGEFEPVGGVGRVLFVSSEGDQVFSDAEVFRRAVGVPGYRVYETAGTAHAPTPMNPLQHAAVVRAVLLAGDAWVRQGVEPPPSTLLASAPAGQIDPVYGVETGIARDADLNALGGVRLPDLAVGRAQYIASDAATLGPGIPPPFSVISGNMVDLACEPRPGAAGDEPRFGSHGDYVNAFIQQVNALQGRRLLLAADAEALKAQAAESNVGAPGSCPGWPETATRGSNSARTDFWPTLRKDRP